jgi:N-acetylneuraminic acid mutarotase
LAAAGNDVQTFYNTAELYDPRTGTWAPTGDLSFARAFHAATELPSGEVVVTGGEAAYGAPPVDKSVEVYNPTTETWISAGSMVAGHFDHTATRLQDGRILVVGGLHHDFGKQRADELGTNAP